MILTCVQNIEMTYTHGLFIRVQLSNPTHSNAVSVAEYTDEESGISTGCVATCFSLISPLITYRTKEHFLFY